MKRIVLIAALSCATTLWAAPAIVQHAQGFTGVATSINVAYPGNVTLHNALIMVLYLNLSPGVGPTISDTQSNTWTAGVIRGSNSLSIYYVCNANAGATTVTVSDASTNLLQVQMMEVSGLASSDCFDNTACNSTSVCGASGTSSAPSVTTNGSVASGEFVVGGHLNGSAQTYTADSPFVIDQQQNGSFSFTGATETQVTSSSGTVTSAPTMGGSASWFAVISAFSLPGSASTKHKRIVIGLRAKKQRTAITLGK